MLVLSALAYTKVIALGSISGFTLSCTEYKVAGYEIFDSMNYSAPERRTVVYQATLNDVSDRVLQVLLNCC